MSTLVIVGSVTTNITPDTTLSMLIRMAVFSKSPSERGTANGESMADMRT